MLLVAGILGACGSTTAVPGSSGSSTAPSSDFPGGRCTGTAVSADRMNDVSSCQLQGGTWRRPTSNPGSCEPPLTSDVCGSKSLREPGYAGDYGKADCIQLLGCTWVNVDGTTLQNPYLGAECTGSPRACATLDDLLLCEKEYGCSWLSSKCSGTPGESCSGNSVSTDPTRLIMHPKQSKFRCEQRGCTFTPPG